MIEISDVQLNIILDILNRHVPNMKVWAFGSRVNGRV